jgi:hypothetical protein
MPLAELYQHQREICCTDPSHFTMQPSIELTPNTAISAAAIPLTFVRSAGPAARTSIRCGPPSNCDSISTVATARGPRAP